MRALVTEARPATLAQVFSCEFCEISKNNFFTEHLWVTASIKHTLGLRRLMISMRKYVKKVDKRFQ